LNLLRRILKGLGIAIAVLLSLIAVAVALIDWDVLQQPIEAYVTRVTGRQLTISGDLDVTLVPQPTLSAEGVHLANAEWSNQPHMLQVEKFSIIIDPLELVTGTLSVTEVHLSGARLLLEHASNQRGNWHLPMDKRGTPKRKRRPSHLLPVPIEALVLHDARIHYRDRTSRRNLAMDLQRFYLERHAEKLVVQGSGAVSEQPL
jgi:uncharacterized protein involved in outer membrane biogenesis